MTSSAPQALPAEPSSSTIPAQPSNPAPEWIRPPDFDARMARVTASVPYDAATFPTLSRAEQIAFYSAMMEAVRREFPDMPVGQVEPKGEEGGWVEMVVDFGRVVKVCSPSFVAWVGGCWVVVLMVDRGWMKRRGRS